jgi:L-amino acid N-acyltransferase YncA
MYIRKRRTSRDDKRIIEITVENFETDESQVREMIKTADEIIIVCNEKHQVIGYLSYRWFIPGVIYIDYVVLDEPYQGQGIAKSLLPKVMEYARKKKVYAVLGFVSLKNKKSFKLFQQWGFQSIVQVMNGMIIGRVLL